MNAITPLILARAYSARAAEEGLSTDSAFKFAGAFHDDKMRDPDWLSTP